MLRLTFDSGERGRRKAIVLQHDILDLPDREQIPHLDLRVLLRQLFAGKHAGKLRGVFLCGGICNGLNGNGHMAIFLDEALLLRPVDQFLRDLDAAFSRVAVSLQQSRAVIVQGVQGNDAAHPVQLHADTGVDGHINRGHRLCQCLIAAHRQHCRAGCRGRRIPHELQYPILSAGDQRRVLHHRGVHLCDPVVKGDLIHVKAPPVPIVLSGFSAAVSGGRPLRWPCSHAPLPTASLRIHTNTAAKTAACPGAPSPPATGK